MIKIRFLLLIFAIYFFVQNGMCNERVDENNELSCVHGQTVVKTDDKSIEEIRSKKFSNGIDYSSSSMGDENAEESTTFLKACVISPIKTIIQMTNGIMIYAKQNPIQFATMVLLVYHFPEVAAGCMERCECICGWDTYATRHPVAGVWKLDHHSTNIGIQNSPEWCRSACMNRRMYVDSCNFVQCPDKCS